MRARLFSLAVLAAATLPGAARAQDLNVITSVALKDEGSTITLSVKGSKAPNFTTFSMADPPRFVIDLSESRFEGVPEDIVVQDGIVNVVKNLSYGSAATSIARIMIAFQVDVEPPDVQTNGTILLVRVAKPGAPAVAAARPAAPAPQAAAESAPAAAPAATSTGGGGGGAAAAGAVGVTAAAAEKDRQAKEQAEAQARADEQRKAEEAAAAAAAAKAEQDRKAREDADAQAKAKAAADEQARLEAEAIQREQAEARARDEAEARKTAEKEGGTKVAAAAPAAPAREEPPPPPPAPAEPVAPVQAPAPTPAPTARLEAGAPSAQLREIGFRQLPGASRVFVRTSVTPRFTVQDVGQNTIRVEMENTRVSRKNDTRFLDTSFFSSAVAMVSPSRRGSTYVVDIKLREKVPYQQKIEGDMLALDFERPARAPAAPPSGSAAGDAAGPDTGPAPGPRDDTAPAAAPAEPARPAEGEPPPSLK